MPLWMQTPSHGVRAKGGFCNAEVNRADLCALCQVWTAESQGQLYQVEKFNPQRLAGVHDGVAMHDQEHVRSLAEELEGVQDVLCKTRGWMYSTMEGHPRDSLRKQILDAKPLKIRDIREGRPFARHQWPRICHLLSVSYFVRLQ